MSQIYNQGKKEIKLKRIYRIEIVLEIRNRVKIEYYYINKQYIIDTNINTKPLSMKLIVDIIILNKDMKPIITIKPRINTISLQIKMIDGIRNLRLHS